MAHLETPSELAQRVGITKRSVRRLIRERKLDHIFTTPGRRIARIPQGAWEKYLREHTVKAEHCENTQEQVGAKATQL